MSNIPPINQRSYEEYLNESRKPKQNLGKNDFLALLAAQMQYQDPLEPQKDTAFVAQLAQFSALEQMENLNSTMSIFQYYSLAGKYVLAEGFDDSGMEFSVHGIVDRVINQNGEAYLQIGDYIVKARLVTQIFDKELFTGSGNPVVENAKLIGMTVRGFIAGAPDENGREGVVQEIVGVVARITIEDSQIMAYLTDGRKLPVSNIIDVRQGGEVPEPEPGDDDGDGDGIGGPGDGDTGDTTAPGTGTEPEPPADPDQ